MKWFSIILISALALLSNACEMHPASELAEQPEGAQARPEPKEGTTAEGTDKAKPEEKKQEDGKPGEAPKFFPDKK